MAYAYLTQRRIIVPAPQLLDPTGTLVIPPLTPLPPPLPPLYCVSVPVGVVPNPSYCNQVFLPGNPVVVGTPVTVRVDPTFLIRMEEQRTQSLIEFMRSEGLVPSQEEETKRENVIGQLKEIVMAWIKKVAWQRRLPKDVIVSTDATILTYGSYGLGVHGADSDIDALCVGPYFATLEEDFFIVLHNMLRSRPEISEILCVKSAKVPLMRFKFNGVSIDFAYTQLQVISVTNNVDVIDPSSMIADETSWRSLSGVHVNSRIRQLVPNLENFQFLLRCVKLWARRRGVYSHLLGFFGGIHLAILAAHVCRRHPNASVCALLSLFFETFWHWRWPDPVILQDNSIPYKHPDERSLMPIMMPCFPFGWCNSNITQNTFYKIMAEFQRAYIMTRDLGKLDFEWSRLFEYFPYTKRYAHFVRIFLSAPDADELQDWVGWVKSRIRSLLHKLETVQGSCDPNPTEYVDHTVAEPNTVFYWGLPSMEFIDIGSVKDDFMKIVNKDRDSRSTRCRLELSIVESSQLPKNVQLDSGGVKGAPKAFWRILDDSQMRRPIYSQYVPHYFVGYGAMDRDYRSAP